MAVIVSYDGAHKRRDGQSSSVPVTHPLPTSVKALTGFIVVLGLILLGIVAWKLGSWRRKKIRAAAVSRNITSSREKATGMIHIDLPVAAKETEKQVILEPYKWQPVPRPAPVHSPKQAVTKGPGRFLAFLSATVHPKPAAPTVYSPPPAYTPDPLSISSPPVIAIHASNGFRASQAVSHLDLDLLQTDPCASTPLPSPARSKSIGPDTPLYKSLASAPKPVPQTTESVKLPYLMVVVSIFVPSLADELNIKLGEPLMMLEEYEDEWCLVQRVGKGGAERGVVPRFCLQEYPAQLPILPNHSATKSH